MSLDAHGGSDVFQATPAQLHIDARAEKLACLRLSEKGLMRWYTSCCRTPVGNQLPRANSPFIGLVQPFIQAADGRTLDQLFGPPRLRIQMQSATTPVPAGLAISTIQLLTMFSAPGA